MNKQKGFTLIELLVVIAIVAVLAVVVILTLNPAELIRQARDSNRISDMATLKSAIALYLADNSTTTWPSGTNCYTTFTTSACTFGYTAGTVVPSASVKVDGTGWLPINFNVISSGAPIGSLPTDPLNNANYLYAFQATSTNNSFKLVASGMESSKYGVGGTSNVPGNDGGTKPSVYEVGTLLTL
jgi:prepilin-type N-terminal cleavage/methylation domain-containing protein